MKIEALILGFLSIESDKTLMCALN